MGWHWTDADIDYLVELVDAGLKNGEIALITGRTRGAVNTKIAALGGRLEIWSDVGADGDSLSENGGWTADQLAEQNAAFAAAMQSMTQNGGTP